MDTEIKHRGEEHEGGRGRERERVRKEREREERVGMLRGTSKERE